MTDEESDELLAYLKDSPKLNDLDKFIIDIPKPFIATEKFRINSHRFLHEVSKNNPDLKVAVVTTLMGVKGYEQFAKFVIGMVEKEQIFENLDDAKKWLGIA